MNLEVLAIKLIAFGVIAGRKRWENDWIEKTKLFIGYFAKLDKQGLGLRLFTAPLLAFAMCHSAHITPFDGHEAGTFCQDNKPAHAL